MDKDKDDISSFMIPELADFDELISLAKIGYLSGVIEKLNQLGEAGCDPQLIETLKTRAEHCDFESVIKIIEEQKYHGS